MNDYDFYLRHAAVRNGEWVGFALARKGLAGISGLEARPHLRWLPWILDPNEPNTPSAGSWGTWQWRMDVAMVDGLAGLQGTTPVDGRTAADMRADLLAFLPLPIMELKDVDSTIYSVLMIGYQEQNIEPYDAAHPNGGWVARTEFAEKTEK
jgi:hypothetical protein